MANARNRAKEVLTNLEERVEWRKEELQREVGVLEARKRSAVAQLANLRALAAEADEEFTSSDAEPTLDEIVEAPAQALPEAGPEEPTTEVRLSDAAPVEEADAEVTEETSLTEPDPSPADEDEDDEAELKNTEDEMDSADVDGEADDESSSKA